MMGEDRKWGTRNGLRFKVRRSGYAKREKVQINVNHEM
jgi:hypothetical protein